MAWRVSCAALCATADHSGSNQSTSPGMEITWMKFSVSLEGFTAARSLTAWAYSDGLNFTFENTRGQAWHGFMGVKAGLSEAFSIALELDCLWLSTTGSHRLRNEPLGEDFSFHHGVKVWSRQVSLSINFEVAF